MSWLVRTHGYLRRTCIRGLGKRVEFSCPDSRVDDSVARLSPLSLGPLQLSTSAPHWLVRRSPALPSRFCLGTAPLVTHRAFHVRFVLGGSPLRRATPGPGRADGRRNIRTTGRVRRAIGPARP